MNMSSAVALNVVLDVAIVAIILSVLAWGIRAHARDLKQIRYGERRRGVDRRQVASPVPAHAERRRGQRRSGRPLTA